MSKANPDFQIDVLLLLKELLATEEEVHKAHAMIVEFAKSEAYQNHVRRQLMMLEMRPGIGVDRDRKLPLEQIVAAIGLSDKTE